MSNTELAPYQGSYISPIVDVHSALLRYQAMKDFIDGVLRQGVDYGKVPGTDKNTLLKPGAEKLSNFFGLAPRFVIVEKELDWTGEAHGGEPFFYFHYKALLFRGDILAAEGEGSASSFEKKYRWRLSEIVCPECGKSAIKKSKFPPRNDPRAAPGWYCHDKAGGCGANFAADDKRITEQPRGQVKNPDIADVVNTLQKMAQKRAYVAAVLLAVNGSEYFTQDVEDFIDGEYTPAPDPEPTRKTPVEVTTPAVTAAPANGKAHEPERAPLNAIASAAVEVLTGEPLAPRPPKRADTKLLKRWSDLCDEAKALGLPTEVVPADIAYDELVAKGKALKAEIDAEREAAKAAEDDAVIGADN